jgi:predicted enzyme related to lactoylglutathione lyase
LDLSERFFGRGPRARGARGRFAEFKPLERLTLVHEIDFIPRVEPYESTIEVDFHASGDHARMVVTLHPHRDPHWTKMSAEGFRSQLTKLDKRFGRTGAIVRSRSVPRMGTRDAGYPGAEYQLDVPDLDAVLTKVRAEGGAVESEFRTQGPKPVAFCSDPFGNGFCVIGERAS